jgi:hypothetical protein
MGDTTQVFNRKLLMFSHRALQLQMVQHKMLISATVVAAATVWGKNVTHHKRTAI